MIARQQAGTWLQVEGWETFSDLVHGFSRRLVDREEALREIHADDLCLHTLKQVHGDNILAISLDSAPTERPEADGLISSMSGVLLGIVTADCVPVLMVEPKAKVAVALHAGWRGTLLGISPRAIEILRNQWNVDLHNLSVALGPAIGGCCYEVGLDVGEALVKRWNIRDASVWRLHKDKGLLDLRAVNTEQLVEGGVPRERICFTGPCTFCDPVFASYRREGTGAGRQLSVIGWR